MIKLYVNINQLNNFLINKEPVEFITNAIDDKYVELLIDNKKLVFTEYNNIITVELRSFRKGVKRLWKKIFKRKKKK